MWKHGMCTSNKNNCPKHYKITIKGRIVMGNLAQTTKADIILNTYALARASWLEDDFVSSFVPMAASLINKKRYETIISDIFASDFEAEYGIKIPPHPAIRLLSILQKKDIIL